MRGRIACITCHLYIGGRDGIGISGIPGLGKLGDQWIGPPGGAGNYTRHWELLELLGILGLWEYIVVVNESYWSYFCYRSVGVSLSFGIISENHLAMGVWDFMGIVSGS